MCQQALLFCYRYCLISNSEFTVDDIAKLAEDVHQCPRLLQLTNCYGSVRRLIIENSKPTEAIRESRSQG